ncbi:MAG TPA: hypothetical protein VN729_02280 [Ktedonobacteraceae bacterium]|nr:hypothetical protein [Ktedonobacteraceae bacterium]
MNYAFSWSMPASRAISGFCIACVAGYARNTGNTKTFMSAAGASSHVLHRH